METAWKITLPDGTVIENLERNADCFISETEPPTMDDLLTEVVASADGEDSKTWTNCEYVKCAGVDNRHWFTFRELSEQELFKITINSKLEYLAMMADVDMEDA